MDGPGTPLGRLHKAWILLSKNGTTAPSPPPSAAHSNLEVVSAAARYALNCEPTRPGQQPWPVAYVPSALSCRHSMHPGDMIFFREDVTHRSQDAEWERLALIVSAECVYVVAGVGTGLLFMYTLDYRFAISTAFVADVLLAYMASTAVGLALYLVLIRRCVSPLRLVVISLYFGGAWYAAFGFVRVSHDE